MTLSTSQSLCALGRLLMTGALALSSAAAWAAPPSDPAGIFRYQLTVLGTIGGQAVLTVERSSALGDGHVRRVRLEARTAGVAERIYKASGDGTTVVDGRFNPLRMKWVSKTRGKPRAAKFVFDEGGVHGTYRHAPKSVRVIDISTESLALDAVSAYVWLPQQPLTLGATYQRPFFDGRRLGTLEATVGERRSIQVPVGLREVVPMSIVAGREGHRKSVVFWIGPRDRVLYRIEVSHGILGTVRADLIGHQRPEPL